MSKGKLLAVCIVWLSIAAALAVAFRFVSNRNKQSAQDATTGTSHYKNTVDIALDSFSGYAVLRSPEMKTELAGKGIRINLNDDGADYNARIQALQSGKTDMAVFTIDALLKVCSQIGDLPGTIVAIIDETRGADAVVAYKKAVPNIDALNRANMKFVLTPDSPSETLARVVMSHFNLNNLGRSPFETANDAEAVYKAYRKSNHTDPKAYVLWEPYVSKVLENPNTHIVADSSQFRGYIVDVLVVNRDYLLKNREVVQDVLSTYFRSAYKYRDNMVQLVLDDATRTGAPITQQQAENLTKGIWWKNTQENFAHFGLQSGDSIQLLEDMINQISNVLMSTGAISNDPTGGQATKLFYDDVIRELQTSNFHPGLSSEVVRDDRIQLPALNDQQWSQLVPVGTLDVPKLVFGRGTDRLTGSSNATLDRLVQTLNSLPQAYVLVTGNASRKGNLDANKKLAARRAEAAEAYLISHGVDANRVRSVAGEPTGTTSVTFVLGQPPY